MKEQWKKLDSDAKLLVNVEEGRPLPIKIELPISAFVSTKDDCCKRLLTILRVFVLIAFLLLLSWVALLLFSYCYAGANLEFEKFDAIADPTFDNDDKSSFRNKVYQPMEEDQPITMTPKDAFANKVTLFAEEPVFMSQPYVDENERLIESMKTWNELSKIRQELVDIKQQVKDEEERKTIPSEEQVEPVAEEAQPQTYADPERSTNEFIYHGVLPVHVDIQESADENDKNLETVDDSQKKQENPEDEMIKAMFQLINAIAFNEQMSVEDASFTRPVSSKLNSEEKGDETVDPENSSNEGKFAIPTESVEQQTTTDEEENMESDAKEKTMDSPNELKIVAPLDFATLLSQYLEPIIGDNDEMLVWYYLNKNKPNFEEDNDLLKVHTAKLLYSTNIADYPADMEIVLNSLLLNEAFAKDLRMLLEGEPRNASPVDYKPNQYRVVDRIATKLNMNKLMKEDPKVLEVFSQMIETINRLELAQANGNPEDLLFGDIAVRPDQGLVFQSPEDAERQRLSVLEAIRKVVNDEVPEVDELETETESQDGFRNVVNAMKKVVIDDETRDSGHVEFVEATTPDTVAIGQENESITEKSGELEEEEEEEPELEEENISPPNEQVAIVDDDLKHAEFEHTDFEHTDFEHTDFLDDMEKRLEILAMMKRNDKAYIPTYEDLYDLAFFKVE